MRKIILFVLILFPFISKSQYNVDYGVSFGVANYLGDIGGTEQTPKKFLFDIQFPMSRPAFGGYFRYKIIPIVAAKASLNYFRLAGNDSLSPAATAPARHNRNLSFTNNLIEFSLEANLMLLDRMVGFQYKDDIKAYLIAGFCVFYHEPIAVLNGQKYKLREYKTENVTYGPISYGIPLGAGFAYTLKRRIRLGVEVGVRLTFTDYIDDVSGLYPGNAALDNDPTRIALSNRTPELGGKISEVDQLQYGTPGSKRGEPDHNDAYSSFKFTAGYVVRGKSSFYRSKFQGRFGKGGLYKKRRFRAKF